MAEEWQQWIAQLAATPKSWLSALTATLSTNDMFGAGGPLVSLLARSKKLVHCGCLKHLDCFGILIGIVVILLAIDTVVPKCKGLARPLLKYTLLFSATYFVNDGFFHVYVKLLRDQPMFSFFQPAFRSAVAIMVFAWVIGYTAKNFASVRIGFVLAIVASHLAAFYHLSNHSLRHLFMLCQILLWAIPLLPHFILRDFFLFPTHWTVSPESKRCRYFRLVVGEGGAFFVCLLLGVLAACVFALPAHVLFANHSHEGPEPTELFAFGLLVASLVSQSTCDEDLLHFHCGPNGTSTLRSGMWSFSRHPNYFFQVMQWVALAISFLSAGVPVSIAVAPVLVLLFYFLYICIPTVELLSTRTDYGIYRAQVTSTFLPWISLWFVDDKEHVE